MWRNGRRGRFKICSKQLGAGSSPVIGIIHGVHMIKHIQCPCGSQELYSSCCKTIHSYENQEYSVEKLIRARYSAYSLQLVDFLLHTTHPCSKLFTKPIKKIKEDIVSFSKSYSFTSVSVNTVKYENKCSAAEYTITLESSEKVTTYNEVGLFDKVNDRWLYRDTSYASMEALNNGSLLPLSFIPNDILRKPCEKVLEITPEIITLIENMTVTMIMNNGIGIAAPQIGVSKSIFIYTPPINDSEFGPPCVVINPSIISRSSSTAVFNEGCLSIPGLDADVKRSRSITIEYQDITGKTIIKKASDFECRILLHEYGHLIGELFTDLLSGAQKSHADKFVKQIKKRSLNA